MYLWLAAGDDGGATDAAAPAAEDELDDDEALAQCSIHNTACYVTLQYST